MGSSSDLPTMQGAIDTLKEFNVEFETYVKSAHRTPDDMLDFGKTAQAKGFKVLIAGAGGAAHLPGMLASTTILPVIGVPVKTTNLDGLDSLLSIVQMPAGVPVATVGVGNSLNAALLAITILALNDEVLESKLKEFKIKQAETSRLQDKEINQ
jgi:5-(carboxyamino)imidazole ribonucleotide mutase